MSEVDMTKKRVDYSKYLIQALLENYSRLEQYQWFEVELGEYIQKLDRHAPFEAAVIAKADLDNALKQLSHTYYLVLMALYMDGRNPVDIGETMRLGAAIHKVEARALQQLYRIMNGIGKWGRKHHQIEEDGVGVQKDG